MLKGTQLCQTIDKVLSNIARINLVVQPTISKGTQLCSKAKSYNQTNQKLTANLAAHNVKG